MKKYIKELKRENEKKTFKKWSVFHSHRDRRKKYEDKYYKNPKYNYRNYSEVTNRWKKLVR